MIVLSNVEEPREGVRIAQPQVTAYFETRPIAEGTLVIAERFVKIF